MKDLWADQQHHQAVDQSQQSGTKALHDEDKGPDNGFPPAAWYNPLNMMG